MPETDRLGPQRRCSAGGSYDEELHGEARGLHRDPPRPGLPEALTAIRELGPTGAEATSADTADSALATWPGRAPALAPGCPRRRHQLPTDPQDEFGGRGVGGVRAGVRAARPR